MPVDHLRYDLLTQDALRGLIRTVLMDAATKRSGGFCCQVPPNPA